MLYIHFKILDCEPYFARALFFSIEASSSSQLFFPTTLLLCKCSSSSSQVVFFFFATARVVLHLFFPILKCLFLQPNHDCCSPSKDVLCALLFSIKGSCSHFVFLHRRYALQLFVVRLLEIVLFINIIHSL